MKPSRARRWVWFCAIFFSLLIHLFILGPEISLPQLENSSDKVLASKKAKAVPKVRLDVQAQKKHGPMTAFIIRPARPAAPPPAPKVAANTPPKPHHVKPKPAPEQPAKIADSAPAQLADSAPAPLAGSALAAANSAPPLPAAVSEAVAAPAASAAVSAPPAPIASTAPIVKPEVPPTFPTDAVAVYRLYVYHLGVDIKQTWHMEGNHYRLEYAGSKFTYKFRMLSTGSLAPEGLQPDSFQVFVNDKPTNAAQFEHEQGILLYGKFGEPKQAKLEPFAQDMASLPYHVAVSYSGSGDEHLQLTTGNAVYSLSLHLVAEDTLDLPAGRIRALHLSGSRQADGAAAQNGYDVWLAPDYLNFPVKFRGPDSHGKIVEFSLKSLEFAGKPMLGEGAPEPAQPEDNGQLPPELQNQ